MRTNSDADSISQNKEAIQNKMETIKTLLKNFDKNLDDRLDIDELQEFLDSNMKNGKKFDHELTKKIFSLIDLNHDEKISCEEFIKTYLMLDEEITNHSREINIKYNQEKANNDRLLKLMMENKNEVLNSDGIGPNAKITIDINDIIIPKEDLIDYQAISIKCIFVDKFKQTRTLKKFDSNMSWNEKFEFQVKKRDIINFQVINSDETNTESIVGTVNFSIDQLTNQEEYEAILEIRDEDQIVKAKINAKIKFIWSYYKLYESMYFLSEKKMKNYKNSMDKINQMLENLNQPFTRFVDNKVVEHEHVIERNHGRIATDEEHTPKITAWWHPFVDNTERTCKRLLNKSHIKWISIIKFCILIQLIISIFNNNVRSDFINVIVPLFMLLVLNTNFYSNINKFLTIFITVSMFNILYDILWCLFSSPAYLGGTEYYTNHENGLRTIIFITSMVNLFNKCIITISLLILKSKEDRGVSEFTNDFSTL